MIIDSSVIVDFAQEGGLARFWYVFQILALDLSDYTVGDYQFVLSGCMKPLSRVIEGCFFDEVKEDLFLVIHYLSELCSYSNRSVSI